MTKTVEKNGIKGTANIIELEISGMTCTSCAARVEKKLNKLPQVATANVNFATEVATVTLTETDVAEPSVITELVKAVQAAGYRANLHEEREEKKQKNIYTVRLVASIVLLIPVAIFSFAPSIRPSSWKEIALVVAAVAVAYSGWPFHKATFVNLKHLAMSMDTLVSLGTLSAFIWSAVVTLANLNAPVYFDEAVGITAVILIGRFIEDKTKYQASDLLSSLFELGAKDVYVLRGDKEELIDIKQLKVDDIFVVKPGTKIATDGIVVGGSSAVDSSIITGESLPVEVGPGDQVIGATINTYGELHVRAEKVGGETALAEIAKLISEAQGKKANIQKLADRTSAIFVPFVVAAAVLTFLGWLLFGYGVNSAFIAGVAVLVVACPCALGLATPIALMVGISRGARLGILIRDPSVLENTRKVTTIIFDKTGTITDGHISVRQVVSLIPGNEKELLSLAASLEKSSEHLIGKAIYEYGLSEKVLLMKNDNFISVPGEGVLGEVAGDKIFVGKKNFLTQNSITIPESLNSIEQDFLDKKESVIFIGKNHEAIGLISLADRVKESAKEGIQAIKNLGIKPMMVTGDNEVVAHHIGGMVGIENIVANAMPGDKVGCIDGLQSQGEVVAMVGDGINDTPALTSADLSIGIGAGTDIALAASDITLMGGSLTAVAEAIMLSRKTLSVIKSNLIWAFGYNIVAIPLAMLQIINPLVSAGLMSFSSIFVVLNALRLKSFHLEKESHE